MVDIDIIEPAPDSFGNRIGRAAAELSRFSWEASSAGGELSILLGGTITLGEAPALWKRVAEVLDRSLRFDRVRVDFDRVESIDSACLALLVHLQATLQRRRVQCELAGGSREVRRLITLHSRRRRRRPHRRPVGMLRQLGDGTMALIAATRDALGFFGELLAAVLRALRAPTTLNWRDTTLTMERAGADAVPIVLLINFLIGVVMAYQSALQLRQFGANIFVVDLVGVAITRELGPLMTAIIICGRSGAAFAAELGTMKVSEEVDALRTLGMVPLRHLVVPRVCGLALVAPVLTLLADAIGILGGALIAALVLDVTPIAFLTQLRQAVEPWDVASGLLKSTVFAAAIALIACQRGLATAGGAEGVGRSTTGAVVATLFSLILLDAVFTLVFGALGL